MSNTKQSLRYTDKTIYIIVGIYVLAILSRYTASAFLSMNLSILLCCIAAAVWMNAVNQRFIVLRQRQILYAITLFIVFMHISQLCKYTIFNSNDFMRRQFWYSYYIPLDIIALLSFYMAMRIGVDQDRPLNRALYLLIIPCGAICLLIQTNDLHQLAFRFQDGFTDWDSSYSHGPLFYVSMIWMYGLITVSFFTILIKCYRRISVKGALVATIFVAVHYILTVILYTDASHNLEIAGTVPITMPMLCNMTYILFWELLIHNGMIPSNTDYAGIFDISGISAQITDADGTVVLRSGKAIREIPSELKDSTAQYAIMLDENTKLYAGDIPGGRIYWQEDISAVNELGNRLRETNEALKSNNAMLVEQAGIRREQAKLEIQNTIYDEIARSVRPYLLRIEETLNDANALNDPELRSRLWTACVLGAYVKRYSNMLLIVRSGNELKPADLVLAVKEVLSNVSIGSVSSDVTLVTDGETDDDVLLDAYHIVVEIILTAYEHISDIRVLIDASDGLIIRTNMQIKVSDAGRDGYMSILDKLKSIGHGRSLFDSYYVEDESQGNFSVSLSYTSNYSDDTGHDTSVEEVAECT